MVMASFTQHMYIYKDQGSFFSQFPVVVVVVVVINLIIQVHSLFPCFFYFFLQGQRKYKKIEHKSHFNINK